MIDLGLSRISRLISLLGNPHLSWKAVHVAGTNGKGSVCSYISSCFKASSITCGRFTSPHLIDRWDCIAINGEPVTKDLFLEVERFVKSTDQSNSIGATDFELLTATAFEIFRRQSVSVAVIEVGLGGRLDATNVLSQDSVIACVITKLGLDHQAFLGSTLLEIATEKAGIIKQGVPVIVDATNDPEVLTLIEQIAKEKSSRVIKASPDSSIAPPLLGAYQHANLSCALNTLSTIAPIFPSLTASTIRTGILATKWPGRLQWLEFNGRRLLLDGAHNPQAAIQLTNYIDSSLRDSNQPITFIMSFSKGKDYAEILSILVHQNDRVIATRFSPVDGMPWVSPCDPEEVVNEAGKLTGYVNVAETFESALLLADSRLPIVVCGSLYLASDVLRAHRARHEL